LSTAQKRGILKPEDAAIALKSMVTLNKPGATFASIEGVKAMTDVTGFGLLGHLSEMCEGSGLVAEIDFAKVPVIPSLDYYLAQECFPGGTQRNWKSYGHKIGEITEAQRYVLADPQTSGGLLVAVTQEASGSFEQLLRELNLPSVSFGRLKDAEGVDLIQVI
jgi:selenide,water dikinase